MLLAIWGCGKSAPNFSKKPNAKPVVDRGINFSAGHILRRDEADKLRKLWGVSWTSAQLEFTDEKRFAGDMNKVVGELFEKDERASQFSADTAHANKEDNRLILEGSVKITSENPALTLYCSKMVWDGSAGLIEASGDVTFESESARLGTFEKVMATPDLKQIATPDMFKKP